MCIKSGEAGEVEESMRELAAVEALKVEKAEKEVCVMSRAVPLASHSHFETA